MEMGFAFTLNRDIFLLNPVPDIPSSAEINAMQPIIINEDINKIDEYYEKLPKAFLSSESVIKIKATSLALREFDQRLSVVGFKTKSGINEQPLTLKEAELGARNRLTDLKSITQKQECKYYVSIESGYTKLLDNYSSFGFSVCIVEDNKGKTAVTIDTDLEIPKTLTDLVPSQYADLGVLVQQKYGVKNKDPYIYFTNGKMSRDRLVFNSVVNTLACI